MNHSRKKPKDPNYGQKVCQMEEKGVINFDPESLNSVVGGEKLTYDEYLEVQKVSLGRQRAAFECCYYNFPMNFKGRIEKKKEKYLCFQRVYVDGMYGDGQMFEGTEEHVWMDIRGFEAFEPGDSVSFLAEVYRYLKTGNGKLLDYGLRNPKEVKKIPSYELPSEEELLRQALNEVKCETCYLREFCNRMFCILEK